MHVRGRPVTLSDDDLLDAARDVFLARGLDATTSEIAKRARISESVIFYRYKTKEALFSAVFERQIVVPPAFAALPSRVGKGKVADNLFDAGMGIVEVMQTVLPLMMMALVGPAKMNVLGKHARKPHPMKRQMINLLSSYLESEAALGRLRAVKGEILARLFLGGILHFVMPDGAERNSDGLDAPTFLRDMIDILLRGAQVERAAARAPASARRPHRRR